MNTIAAELAHPPIPWTCTCRPPRRTATGLRLGSASCLAIPHLLLVGAPAAFATRSHAAVLTCSCHEACSAA
jgi:hypothetical protein